MTSVQPRRVFGEKIGGDTARLYVELGKGRSAIPRAYFNAFGWDVRPDYRRGRRPALRRIAPGHFVTRWRSSTACPP